MTQEQDPEQLAEGDQLQEGEKHKFIPVHLLVQEWVCITSRNLLMMMTINLKPMKAFLMSLFHLMQTLKMKLSKLGKEVMDLILVSTENQQDSCSIK